MKRLTLLAVLFPLLWFVPLFAQEHIHAPKAQRSYGWKKPTACEGGCRAVRYVPPLHLLHSPPPRVDLRPGCPPVYDQGQLGACTAHAWAAAISYDELREKVSGAVRPSRLMIYYLERELEGTVDEDAGAALADGAKALAKWGYCGEALWPYNISRFAQQPPAAAYTAAGKALLRDYAQVAQDRAHMQATLAAGHPIVIGFQVAQSFESDQVAQTGVYNPQPGEPIVGGHAVLIVGYSAPAQVYYVRNSWSASWGMRGYFTVPMSVFEDPNVASDLWVCNTVPAPAK